MTESEFLGRAIEGKVNLKKRGLISFSAHPIKPEDIDRAPTLDLASVPESIAGRVRIVPQSDQEDTIQAIQDGLIMLSGASPGTDSLVEVSTKGDTRLAPGTYKCVPATGTLSTLLQCPGTVTITAGNETEILVNLTARVTPVKVQVVDKSEVEYPGGMFTIRSLVDHRVRASVLAIKPISSRVYWMPPGPIEVKFSPSANKSTVVHRFDVPETQTTDPIALKVIVP